MCILGILSSYKHVDTSKVSFEYQYSLRHQLFVEQLLYAQSHFLGKWIVSYSKRMLLIR